VPRSWSLRRGRVFVGRSIINRTGHVEASKSVAPNPKPDASRIAPDHFSDCNTGSPQAPQAPLLPLIPLISSLSVLIPLTSMLKDLLSPGFQRAGLPELSVVSQNRGFHRTVAAIQDTTQSSQRFPFAAQIVFENRIRMRIEPMCEQAVGTDQRIAFVGGRS